MSNKRSIFLPRFRQGMMVIILVITTAGISFDTARYPIDGFSATGIRRLAYLQDVKQGDFPNVKLLAGALKPMEEIKLNLIGTDDSLGFPMQSDPDLQKAVNGFFTGLNSNYSIAVLDITPGRPIRYAHRKGSLGYQPGSVNKIIVATGFFNEIKNLYPNSTEKRQQLMKSKIVTAGQWAMTDEHTVPIYNPETKKLQKRTVQPSDQFSLYEWLDHMLSVSNNGAACVVWRETILMHVFQHQYPDLTFEESENYFKNTPKTELMDLAYDIVNQPLRELGISEEEWRPEDTR